ncbi:Bacteriophage holin Hol, superfamily III [Geopseudomonas sagittaria]|uniref:Bacteriophage holin Hol, superfamily III n=1 Tax=Geopseudomonas sagittaria TaxID=1135990 RepID=A0A1I5YQ03_9GAMM|nr:phage holin family protein [Pseudomonas sagittaria]SFQ46170.1 Bacteriophage holin Hol, superfamily III [Pseudomonas sagittaria]
MQSEHAALSDMPLWLFIVISMAGMSGEMLRASGSDLTGWEIAKRVTLRFGASGFFGMSALLLSLAAGGSIYLAGGLGIGIAVLGADVAGALYTQWLAKKAGIEQKAGE